jgi:hypothetical protein
MTTLLAQTPTDSLISPDQADSLISPDQADILIQSSQCQVNQVETTQITQAQAEYKPQTPKQIDTPSTNTTSEKASGIAPEFAVAIDDVLKKLGELYKLDESPDIVEFFNAVRSGMHERFAAIKPRQVQVSARSSKEKGNKPRKISPYNRYIAHRFKQNKVDGAIPAKIAMAIFAGEWKLLSKDAQAPYVEEAQSLNEAALAAAELAVSSGTFIPAAVSKGKTKAIGGTRQMSGYNLFYKKNSAQIKANHPDLSPADRLRKVGEQWKALSDVEKEIYKNEAKSLKA